MKKRSWRTPLSGPVILVLLALLAASVMAGPRPAMADGGLPGEDVHISQSLGVRELSVVLRRVDGVPGPLRVDVFTRVGTPAGVLTLRAVPTRAGAPSVSSAVSEGELVLGVTPGSYGTTLRVDRPGPWELSIDDGRRIARIPFIVPTKVMSPPELAAYGGFGASGAFLLVALGVVVWSRWRWLVLLPAGGMVAAVAVAVTGALLSSTTPLPPAPGTRLDPTIGNVSAPYTGQRPPATDYSRPPVNLHVRAGKARAGRPVDLDLLLSDGSTGRPVDDLVVRDDALIHLMVVRPSGRLWHLHPVRVDRGHYQVSLPVPETGHHALSSEFSRRGGGVQLVRSATGLDIEAGPAPPAPPAFVTGVPGGSGRQDVGGTPVRLDVPRALAGTPSSITARLGDTADLQPWLGMAGHLIVVGPLRDTASMGLAAESAPIWAHVHVMAAASSAPSSGRPDESVAAFGPTVRFTYTFPLPGRYRIWVQAMRNYSLLTVPALVEVEKP